MHSISQPGEKFRYRYCISYQELSSWEIIKQYLTPILIFHILRQINIIVGWRWRNCFLVSLVVSLSLSSQILKFLQNLVIISPSPFVLFKCFCHLNANIFIWKKANFSLRYFRNSFSEILSLISHFKFIW